MAGVEALIILGGLVTLVQTMVGGGVPTGVIGLVLAIPVLQGCFSRESTVWLTGPTPRVAP